MTTKEVKLSSELTENVITRVSEDAVTADVVIPVAHEVLRVDKQQVLKGKVRVHKTVEEHLETVNLPLQSETIEIVRISKDEIVNEPSRPKQEGDTLILPIYEEVLVVEKRLRLVEEVHITTKRSERQETHEVLLRQEKVRLERDDEV